MGSYLRAGRHPLIVFVSQLGVNADGWQPVIDLLPGQAVFTYDRAGTGSAEPRPGSGPVTYRVLADELAGALHEARVAGPVVLVGHSVGSHIVRVFAHHYPDDVAGVVLVDGSIPQFALQLDPRFPRDGDHEGATVIDIIAGQVEILQAAPLAVPAVVLTRRRHWWSTGYENIPHPAIDDLWHVHQSILAKQWKAPLVLTSVGHQIPRDAPEVVACCVTAVLDAARISHPVQIDQVALADLGCHVANSG